MHTFVEYYEQFWGVTKLGDDMNKPWLKRKIDEITVSNKKTEEKVPVDKDLQKNIMYFKQLLGEAFDVKYRRTVISGTEFSFIMVDGLCDNLLLTEQVMLPIIDSDFSDESGDDVLYKAADGVSGSIDKTVTRDLQKAITDLLAGNLIMMAEGGELAVCFGVQKFPKRNPSEPNTESQEKGSREGFTELFKDNVAMVRRRIHSSVLKIKTLEVGTTSKTKVCVLYMSDRADERMLGKVVEDIKNAELDTVLGSGYLEPFLDSHTPSLFSGVGTTERPDTLSAKLAEGKIGIIVDGTPYALVVPYLFIEHFHSLDDYLKRPFYATFIRVLKIISFIFSVFLPAFYVAVCTFHQEIIPESMIYGIAVQESKTPLPIMAEAILIHLVYEIVREAGLRMPKSVGHAVSIVGALVIGDAAVKAGIVAAPMLIVVGLTAVSSFVVSSLYEPVAILRFTFIVIGGIAGLYGIMMGFAVVLVNMAAICPYGVPFTSPLSPTKAGAWRDMIMRADWRKMGKRRMQIDKLEK